MTQNKTLIVAKHILANKTDKFIIADLVGHIGEMTKTDIFMACQRIKDKGGIVRTDDRRVGNSHYFRVDNKALSAYIKHLSRVPSRKVGMSKEAIRRRAIKEIMHTPDQVGIAIQNFALGIF